MGRNAHTHLALVGLLLGACGAGPTDSEDCQASNDADGDGLDDCAELDCGSEPLDASELCYACGWARADPGDLESTGSGEGDVIANLQFIDQCEEEVALWDFAGEYHILWMTASW